METRSGAVIATIYAVPVGEAREDRCRVQVVAGQVPVRAQCEALVRRLQLVVGLSSLAGTVAGVKLETLQQTVISSAPDDWHRVDDGGNTFLDSFGEAMTWRDGEEVRWLEHDRHHSRVVYKPNVTIGMAWGMRRELGDGSFYEDWVERFPDDKASAAWLDLLYNGQPVDRRLYVVVDGGRCKIPLPGQIFHGDLGSHEVRRWISYGDYRLFAIVNAIDSGHDYAGYLDRSGLDVAREP